MKPTFIPKTHYLNLCRGAKGEGCPHALDLSDRFEHHLDEVVRSSGWPVFLDETHAGKFHRHHGFQVHVAACPNGCSRPHIADVGLIRACVPGVDASACNSCGLCAESCPDTAIDMENGLPVIDFDLCQRCGHCVHVCDEAAMQCVQDGWRILVGGRLGRHPKLATELPGLFTDEQVFKLLERAFKLYMDNYELGKRFGVVLDHVGQQNLTEGL